MIKKETNVAVAMTSSEVSGGIMLAAEGLGAAVASERFFAHVLAADVRFEVEVSCKRIAAVWAEVLLFRLVAAAAAAD